MKKRALSIIATILGIILLPSCSAPRETIAEQAKLFPANVPDNICYLKTTRQVRFLGIKRTFNATGTIIDGQYIITAGHNVYDSRRTKLKEILVTYKSKNGTVESVTVPIDIIKLTRSDSHYNGAFSDDYAFIRLKDPIELNESIGLNPDVRLRSLEEVEVAGYPGGRLQYGKGAIKKPLPNDSTFYYDVDTAKGMSGGPVWGGENRDSLLGVHVSEGRARAADTHLIEEFEKWKASLE